MLLHSDARNKQLAIKFGWRSGVSSYDHHKTL